MEADTNLAPCLRVFLLACRNNHSSLMHLLVLHREMLLAMAKRGDCMILDEVESTKFPICSFCIDLDKHSNFLRLQLSKREGLHVDFMW